MELVPGSTVGHTTWNGVTRQIVRVISRSLANVLTTAFAIGCCGGGSRAAAAVAAPCCGASDQLS